MEQREVWGGPASDMGLKEAPRTRVRMHRSRREHAGTFVLLSVHPETQRRGDRETERARNGRKETEGEGQEGRLAQWSLFWVTWIHWVMCLKMVSTAFSASFL